MSSLWTLCRPACRRLSRWEKERSKRRGKKGKENKMWRIYDISLRERKREKRTKRIPHAIICSLSVPSSILHFNSSLFPRLTLRFINAVSQKRRQCLYCFLENSLAPRLNNIVLWRDVKNGMGCVAGCNLLPHKYTPLQHYRINIILSKNASMQIYFNTFNII